MASRANMATSPSLSPRRAAGMEDPAAIRARIQARRGTVTPHRGSMHGAGSMHGSGSMQSPFQALVSETTSPPVVDSGSKISIVVFVAILTTAAFGNSAPALQGV